jgi:peptide/nickel transport system permease protein
MTRPADRNLRATSGSGRPLPPGEAGFDWPDCARPARPGSGRGVRLAFALLWGLLGVAVFSPVLAGDCPIVIHASFPGVLERHLDHLARAYPYDVRHGLPGVVQNVGATLQAMERLVEPAWAACLQQRLDRWNSLCAGSQAPERQLAFLRQVHAEFQAVPAVRITLYPVLSALSGWDVLSMAGFLFLTFIVGCRVVAALGGPRRRGLRFVFLAGSLSAITGLAGWAWSLPASPHPGDRAWLNSASNPLPGSWSVFPPIRFAPDHTDARSRLLPPMGRGEDGFRHWLGTDDLGRDMASLVIWGTRTSLFVGLASVALLLLIGITLGAAAGYLRGAVDLVVFRVIEIFESFPSMILILAAVAFLRNGLWVVVLVIGCARWTTAARLVRGEFFRLREAPYVAAARGLGLSAPRIILRHMLPGTLGPVAVHGVFAVAAAILVEASLAFLGLGDRGVISWGQVIDRGRHVVDAWWVTVFPGVALFVTLLTLRALGEGIRANPRHAT